MALQQGCTRHEKPLASSRGAGLHCIPWHTLALHHFALYSKSDDSLTACYFLSFSSFMASTGISANWAENNVILDFIMFINNIWGSELNQPWQEHLERELS